MSARTSNTQQRVEHEVREKRAGEQPVARWRRDSDSVLQLLASPLVSRSPSPVSKVDEESTGEISDVELPSEEEDAGANATEIAEVVAISSDESGPEDASEEEEEGTETVSPEVSSDEDDAARRAARDRMVFRRLSRATAGLGRICLGQIPPSGKPKEWARILEARAVTVRQWEARRAARTQPPSATQPPLPLPRAPTPPPPPPPRSPSPPPSSPPRQQEWHLPQAEVAQTLRTIVVEGRRYHQQTVTWMWPAPEEAAEEARMREAIEWRRPPPLNPREPRAKSAKRVAETADREGLLTPEEEREAQEGMEKGPWEWPSPPETSRDAAPPPNLRGRPRVRSREPHRRGRRCGDSSRRARSRGRRFRRRSGQRGWPKKRAGSEGGAGRPGGPSSCWTENSATE
ncbi:serine/arginine repetitive matrix protein 1-like [Drosophila gunungcola]|uniref:serine/arginine repetitive matrix protein 1-like n=1 Tax=Drosophila gunungcola TaxID=103775 RepID=UPI0022E2EA5C|nr:serine/arginine repetitive matrix protein 1-like [Drosophila gunungcola]